MYRFTCFALLIIALTTAIPVQSHASVNRSVSRGRSMGSGGPFGLGLMLGDPIGLTAKYWTSGTTAVAFGFASSWSNYLELFIDHDWHFRSAFSANSPVVPYIGIGGGMFFNTYNPHYAYRYDAPAAFFGDNVNSVALGLRIPIGIEFLPRTAPLGVFAEIMPGMTVLPVVYGIVQAAIGARYYF